MENEKHVLGTGVGIDKKYGLGTNPIEWGFADKDAKGKKKDKVALLDNEFNFCMWFG